MYFSLIWHLGKARHILPMSVFISPVDSEVSVGEDAPTKKGFFRRLKDALWKEEEEENKEQQANKF